MERNKLLIADDIAMNRDLLGDIFEDRYELLDASDGMTAMNLLNEKKDEIAAVLLDIHMPELDGISVLEKMQDAGMLTDIPVLMITAEESSAIEKKCLDLGATDFVRKPFNGAIIKARVNNAVNLYDYKNHLEEKVVEQTAKLRETNHNIVNCLGSLVESRNLESGQHVQRVSGYTEVLAKKMSEFFPEYGLTPERIKIISEAAALHDIGKIAIPDAILLKPGRLTDEEFEIMKTHTTLGNEYIVNIRNIWDEDYENACCEIARYHHERFDGRGYPEGLKEDEIPISAQLVSIVDVYDALIHERCYKAAFDKETAYNMIMEGKCGTFSPKLLECFKACYPFEGI